MMEVSSRQQPEPDNETAVALLGTDLSAESSPVDTRPSADTPSDGRRTCCRSLADFLRSTSMLVYASHFLSCWGDRMWSFAVGIYLNDLSPENLRLVASYGLSMGIAVVLLGALIGDVVDRYPRLTVARTVLACQNITIALCAVLVALVYVYKAHIYSQPEYSGACEAAIIILTIVAYLFSVAHKVSVEKDWISVICEGDSTHLSKLSSVMRAIDQFTMIAAPVLTGLLMSYGGMEFSAGFIAAWNVVSVVVEYALLVAVYRRVPELAVRNSPHSPEDAPENAQNDEVGAVGESDMKSVEPKHQAEDEPTEVELPKSADTESEQINQAASASAPEAKVVGTGRVCNKVFIVFIRFYQGWAVYMSYQVKYAGLGLAFLYMTVLGFDNITVGYAYNQGASELLVGIMMGLGALLGLSSTFAYPRMAKTLGIVMTGMLGFLLEILALCACVVSVWLPGSPFDITPWQQNLTSDLAASPTTTTGVESSQTSNSSMSGSTTDTMPMPSDAPPADGGEISLSLGFLMGGIIAARFGLWLADLSISQLLLERVRRGQRGSVNGVQSSLNTFMDMFKFILVIAIPAPNQFGLLIIVSFLSICLGALSYLIYMRRDGTRP